MAHFFLLGRDDERFRPVTPEPRSDHFSLRVLVSCLPRLPSWLSIARFGLIPAAEIVFPALLLLGVRA